MADELPPLMRKQGDLSPYTSGGLYLRKDWQITHQVESMFTHLTHYDRVMWGIKTTEGRVIVVMQQAHDEYPGRVGGEIELINAPFKDVAVKGVGEEVVMMRALYAAVQEVRSL